MKTMFAVLCLVFLSSSVNAVVNQEAQRREAPIAPQREYGAPVQPPPQKYGPPINQRRIQAMQRLIAAMRAQGYASQGRVVNRPRPIPLQKPQAAYGPPSVAHGHSSSSGSLQAFTHSHTPGVSCEGWIPIPGPSIGTANSASGAASVGASIDTSYGVPSSSSGGHSSQGTLIVVPEESYLPPPPVAPQNTYGPPVSGHGHSSSSSIAAIDTSYGIPEPPHSQPQVPHKEYGVPNHFSSGGSSHSIQQPDIPVQPLPIAPIAPHVEYGAPDIITHESSHHSSAGGSFSIEQTYGPPHKEYGPPPQPHNEYGPPVIVGSGHASSATAIEQSSHSVQPIAPPPAPVIEYGPPPQPHKEYGSPHQPHKEYGPPPQPPQIEYGTPSIGSGHSSSSSSATSFSNQQIGHQSYGIPVSHQPQPIDFGPPESSYGPPPSGAVHSEETRHGHAADIHTVQSIGTELQLPESHSNIPFNNDISIGTSALGVSAGNSEVIQSHAIHESHTSEVTHNHNANVGDTYSAPPLDSYAPGKYAPSFLTRKPPQPTPPAVPRRPQFIPPRPQYIPPVPQKINRPQLPPPNFRPLPSQNGHAHSIAQSYSSAGHSQNIIRHQPPRQPLVYRPPVPQGLIQSIGHQVQAQDNGHRAQLHSGNTYLPPPTNELPIPPMKLVVPQPGPVQPFQVQSHHSGSGVATSSASFSLQNQDLRHVHVIHDCGKGPQLSQSYGAPYQQIGESHSAVLSAGYSVPAQGLETPQHNSVNFIQQPANTYGPPADSYGPPASGPANLDVIGLESRKNAVVAELQTSETKQSSSVSEPLPGLTGGLSDSGLDFISAHKSHTLVLPKNQGATGTEFKFHIQGSHSEHHDNRVDGPDHQQILADGLLQSILTAIEQQPQSVPQVSEDAETEHKDAKLFLTSREGQEVLADKSEKNAEKAHK